MYHSSLSIYLFLSVHMSLSVCLPALYICHLSVSLSLCLYVYLSVYPAPWQIKPDVIFTGTLMTAIRQKYYFGGEASWALGYSSSSSSPPGSSRGPPGPSRGPTTPLEIITEARDVSMTATPGGESANQPAHGTGDHLNIICTISMIPYQPLYSVGLYFKWKLITFRCIIKGKCSLPLFMLQSANQYSIGQKFEPHPTDWATTVPIEPQPPR